MWGVGGRREEGQKPRRNFKDWVEWEGGGVCDKVIKTFHDIRVCEVPRADH